MRRTIGIGISIALAGCEVGSLPGTETETPDGGIPSSADGLPSTASRLQLAVTTTPTGGQYAPRNIVAVWIEDQAGTFVKTIDRWANTRKQHLVAWTIAAGANDADAVSGATRLDHATPLAITWDLTDRADVRRSRRDLHGADGVHRSQREPGGTEQPGDVHVRERPRAGHADRLVQRRLRRRLDPVHALIRGSSLAPSSVLPFRAVRRAFLLLALGACGSPAPKQEAAPAPAAREPSEAERQKLELLMDEVSRAYDQGDFELAKARALEALAHAPTNVRMLRIVVSASCLLGDPVEAKQAYQQLPARDRADMERRCARYGITFADK